MVESEGRGALRAFMTAAASLAVLVGGPVHGTTYQEITGKKLLLKGSKFVVISRDPSISVAGSNPATGADSFISFDDGSGPVDLNLPTSLWSANGAGTTFKYNNSDAPGGPSIVKVAKVGKGLVKVVGKGVPVAVPNGAASIGVQLYFGDATNAYCMRFTGTGDGKKFLVKDVAAAACPESPAVCGNHVRENSEECDGSDAPSCPGTCQADCTCPITLHQCVLGGGVSNSHVNIYWSFSELMYDISGSVIKIGGVGPYARCELQQFNPVNTPFGTLCIAPGPPCPDGKRYCGPGGPLTGPKLGVTALANADATACTSNANCATQCASVCYVRIRVCRRTRGMHWPLQFRRGADLHDRCAVPDARSGVVQRNRQPWRQRQHMPVQLLRHRRFRRRRQ